MLFSSTSVASVSSGACRSSVGPSRPLLGVDAPGSGQFPHARHPLGHRRGRFAGCSAQQIGRIGPVDVDHHIKTINERAGESSLVSGHRGGRAAASGSRSGSARTRIHGCHQQEPGGMLHGAAGARHADCALLHRLAHGVEHRRGRTRPVRRGTARPRWRNSLRPDGTGTCPPTSDAMEAEWWGARIGGRVISPSRGSASPAAECTACHFQSGFG